jgi:hypothetical protein
MNKNTSSLLPQIHLTDAAFAIITRIYRTIQTIRLVKSSHIQSTTRKLRELVHVECSKLQECNRKVTEIAIHSCK